MSPRPTRPASLAKIRKKDFAAYVRVQTEGRYNMLTEAGRAARAAGLDLSTYLGIIDHYDALVAKYPDVNPE